MICILGLCQIIGSDSGPFQFKARLTHDHVGYKLCYELRCTVMYGYLLGNLSRVSFLNAVGGVAVEAGGTHRCQHRISVVIESVRSVS
jgi:hypothetical protein